MLFFVFYYDHTLADSFPQRCDLSHTSEMGKRYKEFRDDNSDMRNDLTTLKVLALNVPTKAFAELVAISLPNSMTEATRLMA